MLEPQEPFTLRREPSGLILEVRADTREQIIATWPGCRWRGCGLTEHHRGAHRRIDQPGAVSGLAAPGFLDRIRSWFGELP
jgi:hypothetical protein